MTPTVIEGANLSLGAPANWDEARHGPCVRLHIRVTHGEIDDGETVHRPVDYCESAWQPSPEEVQLLIGGGSVVVRVYGGQPPISIFIEGGVMAAEAAKEIGGGG